MEFNAMNFVDNLSYMGTGMLGIFVVMGVIINAYTIGSYNTKKLTLNGLYSEINTKKT